MNRYRVRRNATLVLALALVVLGFWRGEGELPPWAPLTAAFGGVGCLVVAFAAPGKLWKKAAFGVVSLLLYVAAYFAGAQSFGHAFGECVKKGEDVRVLLSEYNKKANQYPERLDQLESTIPCGRITRPNLLKYERTKSGYVLAFGDWLVEHTATESEPFMAHK